MIDLEFHSGSIELFDQILSIGSDRRADRRRVEQPVDITDQRFQCCARVCVQRRRALQFRVQLFYFSDELRIHETSGNRNAQRHKPPAVLRCGRAVVNGRNHHTGVLRE